MSLSFNEFREANYCRALGLFQHMEGLRDWSPTDWTNAVAGEAGELCNLTKKMRRGLDEADNAITPERVMEEVGGVLIYLDLFCRCMGLRLEDCAVYEFNRVSRKRGYGITLGEGASND